MNWLNLLPPDLPALPKRKRYFQGYRARQAYDVDPRGQSLRMYFRGRSLRQIQCAMRRRGFRVAELQLKGWLVEWHNAQRTDGEA